MNKKIILSMLFIPVVTELLSANSNILVLANPIYFLIQVLAYGIPVLLIREAVIRWNLGFGGLFTLGLAYGLFNEGILSRTLSHTSSILGINSTSQFILGLNPYWVIYASIWHAFFAVIFPIAIIGYIYPNREVWIKGVTMKLFIFIISGASLFFIFTSKSLEPIIPSIFILILIQIAKTQTKKILTNDPLPNKKPFLIGFMFIFFSIGSIIIAKKVSFLPFLLFEIIGLCLFYWILKRKSALSFTSILLFGIGEYISFGLFIILIAGFSPIILIPNAIIIIYLIIFARRIIKRLKKEPSLNTGKYLSL